MNSRLLLCIPIVIVALVLIGSNNLPSARAIDATTTVVSCTSPIVVGVASSCTATVTDTAATPTNPTGTVTFSTNSAGTFSVNPCPSLTASGTNAGTCTVSFTPSAVGSQNISGHYNGDANHSASTSANFALTVSKATPALSTAATSPITAGSSTTISATLTGGFPSTGVTGSVTYTRFSGTGCTGTGTTVATVTIGSSNAVPSTTNTPPSAGSFSYHAAYGGDANNNAVTGTCANVTVNKATITSLTTAATSPITVGGSVTLTATLAGGFPSTGVTGTVTYTRFTGSGCTGTGTTFATVTIGASNAVPSASDSPSPAGSYSYSTSYSGDVNNNAFSGTCANVTVNTTNIASLTTAATSPITVGTSTTISASLVGGFPSTGVTGTVTYARFTGTGCTSAGTVIATVTVGTSNAVPSATDSPSTSGSYGYQASYSGDANNNGFTGTCATVTVNKASITSLTTATVSPITVGSSTILSATLVGGFPSSGVTGTITYTRFSGTGCTGTAVTITTVTIGASNGVPTASDTPTPVGNFSYQASYGGDTNNNGLTGTCANVTVNKTNITSLTTAATSPITIGSSTTLSASLIGGFPSTGVTGSVTYTRFSGGGCTGTGTTTGTVTVGASNAVPTATDSPSLPGSYSYQASYSGDANNNAFAGTCANLTVNKASISLTTTVNPSSLNLGQSTTISATIVGGFPSSGVTGTVTYVRFSGAGCTGTGTTVATVTVGASNTVPSASDTPASAGSFSYQASYSGDTNNNAFTGTCGNVSVVFTGLICITTSTTATSCSSAPAIGPLTVGSTFTVGVFIQNSQAMGGFDIYVRSDPAFITPTNAVLGTLIANPSFTTICVNGSALTGACTSGTANGPGVVEVSSIESSGTNECGGISPCSGMLFNITYTVIASTPGTLLSYPTAGGCSNSSVSTPANTCVLVDDALGTTLRENIQGATISTPAVVCITSPSTAVSCSIGPQTIPTTLGSTFTVGVRIESSQPMGGFDIYVSVDPNYLNPISVSLGTLIANPSLTTRCLNGVSVEGACTAGTANGPGVVEVSTIESSGANECTTAPCSGLAFNITYTVVGTTPSTAFSFPSAPGCSTSSVSSPANVCVLVDDATGNTLPETIQGAIVTQNVSTGHTTSLVITCGSPVVVGVQTTCSATVTDTSATPTFPLGKVSWTTDAFGSYNSVICTLSPLGPSSSKCSVAYTPSMVGTGGAGGSGITHVGATYSGDTTHVGSTGSFTLTILRSTPVIASFLIVDQTGLPIPSTGVPTGVSFHAVALMLGGYPVTGAPGTVTYTIFPNSLCSTGTGNVISIVNVGPADNVPSSLPPTSLASGSYSFNALYLADTNNFNVTSACEGFSVTPSPSLGHIHWTHHLSLSKSGNAQSWTVTVSNPLASVAKVVVRIIGSSTINPSLTFDFLCGVTCVSTNINVNLTPGLTPVSISAGGSGSFSFSQPVSASFVGQKVTFSITLYWTTGTFYSSGGGASGSFAVSA